MPESPSTANGNPPSDGFQVSARPVINNDRAECEPATQLPTTYGTDLLYVIARDPSSLFVYWDLNWRRIFQEARISPRAVHLRTYREDESIEDTQPINPFRGHCYVAVPAAGTGYYCELGCFEGDNWQSLVRSGATVTPESEMSEDFSATFATLPVHLSFQRLLDIFETTKDRKELAVAVAELQAEARNGEILETDSADVAALLASAGGESSAESWTEEQRAIWQELTEHLADPAWSGASESQFGGSSNLA